MAQRDDDQWVPLEEAAPLVKRKTSTIISQMRNGRIQRDSHFPYVGDGKLELNVVEYLRWIDEEKEARKLPLYERVIRAIDSGQRKVQEALKNAPVSKPLATQAMKGQPKLIPISVWAEQTFGEYAPHRNTLRSWVRNGKIRPVPVKVGRSYFVKPDAEYIDPVADKIQRMIGGV
ncbi:excisionase [Burkholderia seminalis]|uniref:excisionase n=1 Tax=Burkholderia seminalis TaxID=488731 RepID=UPI00265282DD|nr:excisionase [Burkholderia seminalis]MDN7592369.1 excisionase [Burkholderia seminalis]